MVSLISGTLIIGTISGFVFFSDGEFLCEKVCLHFSALGRNTCKLLRNGLISIIVTAKVAFSCNPPYLFA